MFLKPGVFLLARSDIGCLGQTVKTHTDWRLRDISCLFQHSKFQIHGTTGCIRITVAIHEFFADEILRKMTCKEPVRLKSTLCTSRVTHWHRNLLSLLWAYLLENSPPFFINYFVIILFSALNFAVLPQWKLILQITVFQEDLSFL